MAFDLKNYEMVKDRIKKFYKEYPDGRILTNVDIIDIDGGKAALCKSFIFLDKESQEKNLPKSSGLAFEKEGFNNINLKSWVEVAETSAIGRALANMNIAGKDRPSREEMTKAQSSNVSDIKKINGGVKNV
jgi:hypothetical protein